MYTVYNFFYNDKAICIFKERKILTNKNTFFLSIRKYDRVENQDFEIKLYK